MIKKIERDDAIVIDRRKLDDSYEGFSYLILEKLGSDLFKLDIRSNYVSDTDHIYTKGRLIDWEHFEQEQGPFPEIVFVFPDGLKKAEEWLEKVGWDDTNLYAYILKKCAVCCDR